MKWKTDRSTAKRPDPEALRPGRRMLPKMQPELPWSAWRPTRANMPRRHPCTRIFSVMHLTPCCGFPTGKILLALGEQPSDANTVLHEDCGLVLLGRGWIHCNLRCQKDAPRLSARALLEGEGSASWTEACRQNSAAFFRQSSQARDVFVCRDGRWTLA